MKATNLKISYSNIEDAVASFLIATSAIPDDQEIISIDIPVKDESGLVDITVHTSKIK